jgi:hypothetical protein
MVESRRARISNGRVFGIAAGRYLERHYSGELVKKERRVGCVRLNEPKAISDAGGVRQ